MPEKMQVMLDEDVSETLRWQAEKNGRSCSKEASVILRANFEEGRREREAAEIGRQKFKSKI